MLIIIHMLEETERRRLPSEARQRQLVEVAVRVFARAGYDQTSTADLAREAGISAPALYRHFPSKKALYLAALRHVADRQFDDWQRIIDRAPSAASGLASLGQHYQRMLRDEPHLSQMRFRSLNAADDPDVRAVVIEQQQRARELILALCEQAGSEASLPAGLTPRTVTAAFMAWGALTDVVQHLQLDEQPGGDLFEGAISDLVQLMAAHARPQPPGTEP